MSKGKKVRMRLMPYCKMFAEYMLDRFDREAARGVKLGRDKSQIELLALEFSIFFNRGREQENASWPGANMDGDPILRNKVLLTALEEYRQSVGLPQYPIEEK